MRIDAHQHFWDPKRGDYGWLDALRGMAREKLNRPILPAEMLPLLESQGIERTVLVQAAASEAEADFLLSLAAQHDFIAGAVVWLDMASPRFAQRLAEMQGRRKFLGIRPMIHDIEDALWMLGPDATRAFAVLEESGTCFDFLIRPLHLVPTLGVLKKFPKLRAVVDHVAKPNISARHWSPWCDLLRQVAEHEGVYCKLSGMITEADLERWAPEDLRPYIAHALACFGPERSMFGSDWPVCTLAGDYARVVSALEQNLAALQLSQAQLDRVFGETAREFYRLP